MMGEIEVSPVTAVNLKSGWLKFTSNTERESY